jgi:hypothetical protein
MCCPSVISEMRGDNGYSSNNHLLLLLSPAIAVGDEAGDMVFTTVRPSVRPSVRPQMDDRAFFYRFGGRFIKPLFLIFIVSLCLTMM